MWSGLRLPARPARWTVFGARARQKPLGAAPARDGVGPVLVGVPCLGWWLDKFDWHARTASAPQLSDKSGCNNELGAKVAGTSVRSLSGGTGNSKGANGESRLVDPARARGHSNRPTGGLAPERSGGGKVVLPAATLRRRHGRRSSRPRRRTHASLLAAFHECERMQAISEERPMPRSTDRGMAQPALRKCLSSWPPLTNFLSCLIHRLQSRDPRLSRRIGAFEHPLVTPRCFRQSAVP